MPLSNRMHCYKIERFNEQLDRMHFQQRVPNILNNDARLKPYLRYGILGVMLLASNAQIFLGNTIISFKYYSYCVFHYSGPARCKSHPSIWSLCTVEYGIEFGAG